MTRALVLVLVAGVPSLNLLVGCRSQNSTTYSSSESSQYASNEGRTAGAGAHARANEADEATDYEGPFDDQYFVEQASQGGLFEVESSRLALEQRSSQTTCEFARMMIDDHGKTSHELATLARRKDLRASSSVDALHQEKLDELRRIEGAEFDTKYRQCQIKAHDEAIALFERAARDCRDSALKAFAQRTLPTLRTHRSHLTSPAIEVSQR